MLFDLTHPAHVHFFRNSMQMLSENGHEIFVLSRKKDVTLKLLDRYRIRNRCISTVSSTPGGLLLELLKRVAITSRFIKGNLIQCVLSVGGTFSAPAARLCRVPSVVFYNTESARVANAIGFGNASLVVTSTSFDGWVPKQHMSYSGYHELAYLHPSVFKPDLTAEPWSGVPPGESKVLIRFVSWRSSHDIGHSGMSETMRRKTVESFARRGRVVISSERKLSSDLDKYRYTGPPENMHSVISNADLVFGESGTMTSEAAVLGTPAVFIDSSGRGYAREQERKYGLVRNFDETMEGQKMALETGLEMLNAPPEVYLE
ncbi:MAG TPA: DUF354 domain-containing protein [Deltaproteobacteria bacterium]|nr:DUF354 domain-containing protein [Deltaproteobacteria bacterium]